MKTIVKYSAITLLYMAAALFITFTLVNNVKADDHGQQPQPVNQDMIQGQGQLQLQGQAMQQGQSLNNSNAFNARNSFDARNTFNPSNDVSVRNVNNVRNNATAGATSDASSLSNAGSVANATGGNGGAGGNSQNVNGGNANTQSTTYNQVRQTPFAYSPGLANSFSQENCANSASVGVSAGFGAIGGGVPVDNDGCNRRRDALIWAGFGQNRVACEVMAGDDNNLQAMQRAGVTCASLTTTPSPVKVPKYIVPTVVNKPSGIM